MKGLTVAALLTEENIKRYGYLPLSYKLMQAVGSAAQTLAAIKSHWRVSTYADERTIADAACLDESTVRRRHLPKLISVGFLKVDTKETPNGGRREWHFSAELARHAKGSSYATLTRWAALALPEWSYRAIYATVLQQSLATARSSKKEGVEIADVVSGEFGRHKFSLSDLIEQTGLGRHAVIDAKTYLIQSGWILQSSAPGNRHELLLNLDLVIDAEILKEAHRTTSSQMFKRSKKATPDNPIAGRVRVANS